MSGKPRRLVFLVYLLAGAAVYAPALNAFLVGDDFEFLGRIAESSPFGVFQPLIGRFVRPTVVLVYTICFQTFGLVPWPYHIFPLLAHVTNAYLVYVLGGRLFGVTGDAFLAGLLFLLFSAHSEAVAWPAGMADPFMTLGLLCSLLGFLGILDEGPSLRRLAGFLGGLFLAAASKELWVVYPGILLAYVLIVATGPQARRRAVMPVLVTLSAAVLYLLMRRAVFGTVLGGYAGIGTPGGLSRRVLTIAMFVVRCFIPAGPWFERHRDALAVAAPAAILTARWRASLTPAVLFTAAAMGIALTPVLPLSISMSTTESERLVYLATVFSSLLTVAVVRAYLTASSAVVTVCSVLIAWHSVVLAGNARRWHAAGDLFRSIRDSFVEETRAHPPPPGGGFAVLNLPDSLHGAYVCRGGFQQAVRFRAPDVAPTAAVTIVVSTAWVRTVDDAPVAVQHGKRFHVDVAPGRLFQVIQPEDGSYRILAQTRTAYDIEFTGARPVTVYLVSHGRLVRVGAIE